MELSHQASITADTVHSIWFLSRVTSHSTQVRGLDPGIDPIADPDVDPEVNPDSPGIVKGVEGALMSPMDETSGLKPV
jgi:hypothetical protein